jgi:mycothiol synthase
VTSSRRTPVKVTEEALTRETAVGVLELAMLGEDADGVAPLSEQALLRVRHASTRPTHLVARIPGVNGEEDLAGYLLLQPGGAEDADDLVAELVVHPDHRREGVGTALLTGALAAAKAAGMHASTLKIWAHGDRADAAGLADQLGFSRDRILLQMTRSTALPLPEVKLPDGITIRTFRPGTDDEAWVALNAAAFAGHPEQAYVTMADLRERQEERWFDPAGFFLAERVADGRLVGFHWTKVHERPERVGEVYVVGLHPEARGTGLGLALTVTGLEHLASLGLAAVILYADETNTSAVRMYERLGFTISHTDVEYARPIVPAPAG